MKIEISSEALHKFEFNPPPQAPEPDIAVANKVLERYLWRAAHEHGIHLNKHEPDLKTAFDIDLRTLPVLGVENSSGWVTYRVKATPHLGEPEYEQT